MKKMFYIMVIVFRDVNISALTLKVPASAVEAYKAAPVWGEFGNIIANE
jgi:hypothetical protein